MKKVLALILAVLMVTSCMTFAVSAQEAKAETDFKFVAVSDCDTTNDWTYGSVYADEKTQGNASIKATDDLALEFSGAAKDVSEMTMIVFDLYISDVEALTGVSFTLSLRDVNGDDANTMTARATLNDLFGRELVSGWNHIELPLATLNAKGTVDLAQWSYFALCADDEAEAVIAVDNLYFCNKEAVINSYLLSDFEGNGMFYTNGAGTLATETWAKSFYGAGSGFGRYDSGVAGGVYVIGDSKTAGGTLGTTNFFRSTLRGMAVDIRNAANGGNVFNYPDWFVTGDKAAIQMDVYMSADGLKDAHGNDMDAADLSIGLSLATGSTDSWGFYSVNTARLSDGQDLGNGWYRVTFPMSGFGNVNLQKLYAMKVHGDIDINYGVSYTGNFNVQVDNLRYIVESDYVAPEPETPNRFFDGRYLLSTWDYTTGILADLPWNSTKNVTWSASFKGQGADFNGQVARIENGYLVVGEDTNGGSLSMSNYFLSTVEGNPGVVPEWMDDPFVSAIQIDVKIDATGLKKDGKDMDVSDLAINWGMQTDAGKDTSNRAGYSRVTFTLDDGEALGDGWYRITIPAETFTKYMIPGYSWVNMAYMDFRSDVEANVGVSYSSLKVCVDNIAVIPATPEEGEGGEGSIDVEKPHADNFVSLFNVDDVSDVYPTCDLGWPTPKALLGDLDGDGDDEFILANYAGGGEKKGNAGFTIAASDSFDFSQLNNVEALVMDIMFLQDGFEMGTDVITLRFLGGGTYNSYDGNNGILSASFMAYRGEALGNGWYRVTIPADEFTYTAADDTGAAFTWEDAYNMHIIFNNRTFGDTLQVAVDNIGVLIDQDAGQVIAPTPSFASIDSAKLVLTDNFGLTFRATVQNAQGAYVEYNYNGATTVTVPETTDGLNYTFAFDGILAHQLGDTLSATLWAMDSNGKLVSATLEDYSVESYCYRVMAKNPNATALNKMLNAVLDYGAAAQLYADYKTDALVNAAAPGYNGQNISRHTAKMLLKENVLGEATDDKVWKSATLLLDNSMTIRYYFTADSVDGLTVNVAKGGFPVETVTEFGYDDATDRYYVDVPVNAAEYNAVVTVDFGGSYAVNYSVNHYLAKNYGQTDDAAYNDLLTAIFRYGYQARIYMGMAGV